MSSSSVPRSAAEARRLQLPIRGVAASTPVPTAIDSRSLVPCIFFARGNCRNRPCPYSHDTSPAPRPALDSAPAFPLVTEPAHDDADDNEKDGFTRTLAGAFVCFEDGGRVSKICLPGDFSAARLSSLPADSTASSVQVFLANLGFDVSAADIKMQYLGATNAAIVRAEDTTFSKRLCARLQAGHPWGAGTALVQVSPVTGAASMTSGQTAGRLDCRKVNVSWHKAVRTAWLNFGDGDIARRVSERFNAGVYKILDQKVSAGDPVHSPRVGRRQNHVSWTVRLSDVPPAAREADIKRAISRPGDQPRHVELGLPTYAVNDDHAAAVVRSLLTKVGPVEYWEVTLESTAKRAKAKARFLDEADARMAASELNQTTLPFHSNGKLYVQLVYSVKFKVGSDIYDAVQTRIATHSGAWKRDGVFFFAYANSSVAKRYRILKLEGESDKAVASAKSGLATILAGSIAKEGEDVLWDPSLAGKGRLWQDVKKLGQSLSVVIMRDRVKSLLRLFGSQTKCDEVERRLLAMLRAEEPSAHIIELQRDEFQWVLKTGFSIIDHLLGPKKFSLDIVSKNITIQGSLPDLYLARDIIDRRESTSSSSLNNQAVALGSTAGGECSVCWTEADSPVRTACNHLYCQECLENSSIVPPTTEADFTLLCHGNASQCGRKLSLQDLHEHLSTAAFEAMLELSFTSYVQRHPDQVRFCPTPDCGFIYRTAATAKTHTCANCLQPTCSACHAPHAGGMTCAEYRDLESGGNAAFERWKREKGAKDCPKCGVAIEKAEGCNHMTCSQCKTHMCWVCMKVFATGDLVYGHMTVMHGGHVDLPRV